MLQCHITPLNKTLGFTFRSVLKISGISLSDGHIFQFGPGKANKIENFLLQIQNHDQSHLLSDQIVNTKIRLCFGGPE